jgi:two-component system response regulator VicR
VARRKKILCIEDDPEMIQLLKLILERKGFDLIGAEGALEGLNLVRQEKPDLILLDLMMPEIDGWEVYRQIKADREISDIPVVVVTARAQSIDRVLGLQVAHVQDYVVKPFDTSDLVETVNRVLEAQPG